MKRFNLKLFAVSIIMAIVATSCIDDQFDTPPIKELPVGSVVTLQNLRDLCPPGNTFKIKGDSSLYATVTMDESSGNLYKTVFVQDNTGAVNLRFSSATTLSEGDSIRIYLKGAILSWYNNLFKIDSLHADYSVVKQAVNKHVEPQVVTITDINLDKSYFQSRLVKIENVQIRESDLGKNWAPYQEYGEINIEDLNGNTMLIRTSGYSKFASQKVPEGLGSMIAVVGLYRETVQLTIRRASEINFTEPRYVPVVTGTGTKADPWDVATAITLQNQEPRKVGFVKGFIVGSVKTGVSSVASTDDIHFTTPVTSATNVVLADDPNERDLSKLIIINLPSAKPLRTQVNLLDNPENLGKWLNVSGALRSYFGLAGSRDSSGELTEFEIEGGGSGGETTIFSETFATGQGNFTIVNVLKPEALDNIWYHNTQYSQMAAGAYKDGTNHASEAWLISPAIDLSSVSAATFTFDHAGKQFGAPVSNLTIQVSTVYSGGEVNAANWTQITIPNHLSGETNTFKSAGDMDLTQYCGNSNVRIAFKYTSTTTGAGNWYVKNVVVK